ncbi:bstEII [Candidatus Chloroploca sp. Khr17]|uniref:bstEII n=1 Tax=Candidatus Chloroploca sp. Khr17 TaxID=2496869 RepID=UPI00101D0B5A|nr:bstEII [Candidatus Chloroploca sp. Khr17]
MKTTFSQYRQNAHNWITLATGEFYPDILVDACLLYTPVLEMFGRLVRTSESSERLFMQIADVRESWMRIQLSRVFKRYVSPGTPVEMLKKKSQAAHICHSYKNDFRPIHEVQAAFSSRPIPDEPLCALLWEYKDRGKKGYDLTERFFELFRSRFPHLLLVGPERAGRDVLLGDVFVEYPNPKRPVDFIIYSEDKADILAVGLARYDSDRGGAQEDDRTGGYRDCAREIITYAQQHNLPTKVILLNDGPGLLLGSMWHDYAAIEEAWQGRVMITTLRMVPERISAVWLYSREV